MANYTPLFDANGKRDKARRFVNEKDSKDIISRRQHDNLTGAIASRPSSGKRFKPESIPSKVVSAVKREVPITQTGGKKAVRGVKIRKPPSRYSADIQTFAKKHNMKAGDVRKDPQFKLLNKDFSRKAKQRDALINEIALKNRKKEDATNLIEKKNELDEELGHLARELGRKKPEDFSPFGQTP
jgi:predicted GIY-YIG superfamily endonuclease